MKTIKKIGKWLGYTLLTLLLIGLGAYAYAYWQVEQRLNKVYPMAVPAISILDDSSSIVRGAHLYVVHGCRDCHMANLGGRILVDHPLVGRLAAANLTKGKGGLRADFGKEDWLRTLKHGLNREGKPLLAMPANETTHISDQDLADIIAFCQSQPAVDNLSLPKQQLGPLLRLVAGLVEPAFFPAEQIDHTLTSIPEKQTEESPQYGKYLTTNCAACHRPDFRGGPPMLPGYPPVPDITSQGRVGKWTETQFMHTLRTGITPEGHKLDSTKMPWTRTREFSETELKAVRSFLLSLPEAKELVAN